MSKRRFHCSICGDDEGPAIFSFDTECSDACRKVATGEWTVEEFQQRTGKTLVMADTIFRKPPDANS